MTIANKIAIRLIDFMALEAGGCCSPSQSPF